ncbi:MAG: lambda exonuclease family protein [Candidatus Eiseniibacteriota bacterium]
MRILEVPQGSPEWQAARAGIPTASQFDRILTPTGRPSAAAVAYMHELLAERFLGTPLQTVSTALMERGSVVEAEAVAWYEFQQEVSTGAVGFCLRDDGRAGCSPDRLVGDDGGLELKCPSPGIHIGYLLGGEGIGQKYYPQVQGCLWVTGREWWDTLSYHPDLPPALLRVHRDEEYIRALAEAVEAFCGRLEQAVRTLVGRGLTLPGTVETGVRATEKAPAASAYADAT